MSFCLQVQVAQQVYLYMLLLQHTFLFISIHCESTSTIQSQSKVYPIRDDDLRGHENAYVAICIIIRDANENDLREWITYHKYIGVGKMYLFDDFSRPSMLPVIQDFVDSGLISYFYLGQFFIGRDYPMRSNFTSAQTHAYNSCIRWFGHRHIFIGFIDYDEFVVLRDENNKLQYDLVQFLKEYEDYGGVHLQWRMFGSSGYKKHQRSTLNSYIKCIPSIDDKDHQPQPYKSSQFSNVKTFINTKYSKNRCVVHTCDSTRTFVNTNFQEQNTFAQIRQQATWKRAFLNHYRIKSKEDFDLKLKKGPVTNFMLTQEYRSQYFTTVDDMTTADCKYMKEAFEKCCTDTKQQ